MGMNIGQLVLEIVAGTTQLEPQITSAAEKAGDKAGKTLGQRLAKGMSIGLGALAGGALGLIASQGAKLNDVMADLSADTGLVGDEAERARKALGGIMGDNNIVPLETLGDTMAKVHNDLGLTGDAMDAMTARFAKYEQGTKQDASAVSAFDDILDAWNLTADKAPGIMDQLVASHQKYGGSIADNQKALAVLAPQLKALNMDVDDGVALLNLFAASGMDSSKATFALNTAVKNLKPGQSLNDLIAQVAAIEDPTKRAQKAIELFGARGGVSLANVLRPGVDSLDDFGISASQAAGATDKAADSVLSWQDRATAAFNKVAAAAGEFGQSFGPLLMLAGQLGPKLTTSIGGGLGAIFGLLVSKSGESGKVSGIKWGNAFKLGALSVLAIGVGALYEWLEAMNREALENTTKAFSDWASRVGTAEIEAKIAYIRSKHYPKEMADAMLAGLEPELQKRMAEPMQKAADAVAAAKTAMGAAAKATFGEIPKETDSSTSKAEARVKLSMLEIARSIREGKQGLTAAWSDAIDEGRRLEEIGLEKRLLILERDSKEHKAALKSKVETERIAAQQREIEIQKSLAKLLVEEAGYGTKAQQIAKLTALAQSAEMKAGLASDNPDIATMWQGVQQSTNEQLWALRNNVAEHAKQTGLTFAEQLKADEALSALRTGIAAWQAVLNTLHLPPAVQPVIRGGGGGPRPTKLEAGMPYVPYDDYPALLHAGEAVLTAEQADRWRAGDRNVTVNVAGLVQAKTPDDIARVLRRVEA